MNYESGTLGALWDSVLSTGQAVASDAMGTYRYVQSLKAQIASSKDQVEVARLQAQLATAKIELAKKQLEASGSAGGNAAKTAAIVGGLAALGLTVAAAT